MSEKNKKQMGQYYVQTIQIHSQKTTTAFAKTGGLPVEGGGEEDGSEEWG